MGVNAPEIEASKGPSGVGYYMGSGRGLEKRREITCGRISRAAERCFLHLYAELLFKQCFVSYLEVGKAEVWAITLVSYFLLTFADHC